MTDIVQKLKRAWLTKSDGQRWAISLVLMPLAVAAVPLFAAGFIGAVVVGSLKDSIDKWAGGASAALSPTADK